MCSSITVVIPAYNAENSIEKSIQSALDQTVAVDEIIVVDDGSVDRTAKIVETLYDACILVRQENQGSAVARQVGSELSTSDYIAYLDADDWWPKDKIQKCHEIINKEPVDFLIADLQRARPGEEPENCSPRNSTFFPWAKHFWEGCDAHPELENLYRLEKDSGLILLLRGFPVFPSTVLVKRSVVDAVGGWDRRFLRCQDFDFGLRVARNFPLYYHDDVQAVIGLHQGNDAALSYQIKQTTGDIKVLQTHFEEETQDSVYRRQVAEALGRKYRGLGYTYRMQNDNKMALRNYVNAIKWPGARFHTFLRCLWLALPIHKFLK